MGAGGGEDCKRACGEWVRNNCDASHVSFSMYICFFAGDRTQPLASLKRRASGADANFNCAMHSQLEKTYRRAPMLAAQTSAHFLSEVAKKAATTVNALHSPI